MDVMLQRHCARYIYVVPEGLRELLTDISREVLRSQPDDTYTFIADYLDALLITRENARVAAKFVTHMAEAAETIVDLLDRTGMSREEANRCATVIQEAFRSWSERRGILKEDEDTMIAKIIEDAGLSEIETITAALVIQNAFKAFKQRQQRDAQLLSGIIDWRVAARSAIKLYRKTGVSPEEAHRVATLIKAAYKGYYTRRAIRLLNQEMSFEHVFEEESPEDEGSQGSGRKSKGVRIDYGSVVPHVDFGDEELFSRDLTLLGEDEKDLVAEEVGTEQFITSILQEILNRIEIAETGSEKLPSLYEKESETDAFMAGVFGDADDHLHQKSLSIPQATQLELEQELDETKDDFKRVSKAADEARKAQAEQPPPEAGDQPPAEQPPAEPAEQPPAEGEQAPAEGEQPPAEATEAPPAETATEEAPAEAPPAETAAEEAPAEAPPAETATEEAPAEAPPEAPAEAPAEAPPGDQEEAPPEPAAEGGEAPPAEAPKETGMEEVE